MSSYPTKPPRHQDDSAEPREGDSRAGVKQAVDPKGASQELHTVWNPLPPMFERLPGQRIIAARERPSNTPLNGMIDLNLSRISAFATRLAWPEGLLGRIRYDRKSSDQSESGQWNVGGLNCPSDQSESGQRNVGGPNCPHGMWVAPIVNCPAPIVRPNCPPRFRVTRLIN